jgi:hypothetical protein
VKWGFFTNYEISRGCVSSLVGELAFDRKRTFDDHEVEEPVNRCEDHHIYWSISSAGEQSRIPSNYCKETLNIVSSVEVQQSTEYGCDQRGNTSEGYVFHSRE